MMMRINVERSTWIWIVLGLGLLLSGGVALIGVSPTIRRFGEAVATAEGFYVEGSRPQRNDNPGNLTMDLTGKGIGWDGPFVRYANSADGFEALYKQISEWFSGISTRISGDMTIAQAAQIYSPNGWLNWANNVANYLGVSIDTTLNQIT
jgi:hypothetical protein